MRIYSKLYEHSVETFCLSSITAGRTANSVITAKAENKQKNAFGYFWEE